MKLFGSLSELVSILFRKNGFLVTAQPNQSTTYTDDRAHQLPPGDSSQILLSETATQTVTGKTIDGDDNTVQDLPVTSIKTVLADANKALVRNASGVPTSAFITDANVDAAAGIAATKIANGSVSNTEFQYLDGVTSAIQTQIDSKVTGPASATDEALARFDGTTGKLVQNSLITVSDAGAMAGITQLDVDNIRLDGNTISSTNSNGNLIFSPNGTGVNQFTKALDIPEITTPASPSAGSQRVYAKADGKLYKLNSAGVESGIGGSGAGEKNYIADPDTATSNWVASGAGVTVATSTTAAELPEESKATGIKITGVSGTDYVRYRFTLDDADKSKKNKIQFALKTAAGYATNDFKVEMYTNTASNYGGSYTSLQVQTSSQIPKNDSGAVLQYTFDSDTSDYYELRITRVSGTSFIVISGVVVGPGAVAQGAAFSGPNSYTLVIGATTTAPTEGSGATKSATWWRVGSKMRIQFEYTQTNAGSAGSGTYLFPIPAGYTIDTSLFQAGSIGTGGGGGIGMAMSRSGGTQYYGPAIVYNSTNIAIGLGDSAANVGYVGSVNNPLSTAVTYYSFEVEVPITQWANNGTLNVLQEDNLKGWIEYPLTIGAVTTPPTKGTIVYDKAYWRRVGDTMEVRYDFRQTTAGSAGSGAYLFPLPTGYTIDTTKITPSTNRLQSPIVGHGFEFADNGGGGTVHTATARAYSTTQIWMMDEAQATTSDNVMHWSGSDNGRLSLAGMTYGIRFTVPITEFRNAQNALVGFAGATNTEMGLVKLPGDYVYVNTGNGNGSTATRRRRFSGTATTVGTAITYAMTAANGSTFTINQRGVYAINYGDQGSVQWGAAIARNTNGTTNPGSLTALTQRLAKQTIQAGFEHVMNWTGVLEVGDVVEMINDTAANDTTDQDFVYIVQVAKL